MAIVIDWLWPVAAVADRPLWRIRNRDAKSKGPCWGGGVARFTWRVSCITGGGIGA